MRRSSTAALPLQRRCMTASTTCRSYKNGVAEFHPRFERFAKDSQKRRKRFAKDSHLIARDSQKIRKRIRISLHRIRKRFAKRFASHCTGIRKRIRKKIRKKIRKIDSRQETFSRFLSQKLLSCNYFSSNKRCCRLVVFAQQTLYK